MITWNQNQSIQLNGNNVFLYCNCGILVSQGLSCNNCIDIINNSTNINDGYNHNYNYYYIHSTYNLEYNYDDNYKYNYSYSDDNSASGESVAILIGLISFYFLFFIVFISDCVAMESICSISSIEWKQCIGIISYICYLSIFDFAVITRGHNNYVIKLMAYVHIKSVFWSVIGCKIYVYCLLFWISLRKSHILAQRICRILDLEQYWQFVN